jgi:hypothetical protein
MSGYPVRALCIDFVMFVFGQHFAGVVDPFLADLTVGDARFFFIDNDIFYAQATFNKTSSSMIVFFTSLNKVG